MMNLFGTKAGASQHRRSLEIRRVTSDDTALLVDLLAGLSAQTRHLRYMTPRPMSAQFAALEAARMLQGRARPHLTVIALCDVAGRPAAVAVAELMRDMRDPTVADVAVVVRDGHQGQRIGTELVSRLVRHAASSGIHHLRADMLAENKVMRHMVRRLGLPLTITTRDGETQVIARVQPQFADKASIEHAQREIYHDRAC